MTLSPEEVQRRENGILEMSLRGLSNEQMAKALGLTEHKINRYKRKLIQEDRLNRHARSHRAWGSEEERKSRQERVAVMWQSGSNIEEIVTELQLPRSLVNRYIYSLIDEGKLKHHLRGRPPGNNYANLKDSRVKTVIALKKERATLNAIGSALGVGRERARQIIGLVAEANGAAVLQPAKPAWSTAEAAQETNVSYQTVRKLCAEGIVPCKRRNPTAKNSTYLLERSGLRAIRRYNAAQKKIKEICIICGSSFSKQSRTPRQKTCSVDCRKEHDRNLRISLTTRPPSFESLGEWQGRVFQRLQEHTVPPNEQWLCLTDAVDAAGTSRMQLEWLLARHVVSAEPDPVKRWRERPMMTYAASEMEIVRQVYAEYQQRMAHSNVS